MRYLLDTDICSYVIRARDPRLLAVMEDEDPRGGRPLHFGRQYAEMELGAERSRTAERYNAPIRAFRDRLSGVAGLGPIRRRPGSRISRPGSSKRETPSAATTP